MNSAIFKAFFLSLLILGQVNFAYAQTASILPPAKTSFFDNSGNPLTSGKVYTYIPATTTNKTTWQDAAETIPNTNPVILDAAGRALILGEGTYRQIVRDRNNNLIWDAVTSSTGSGGSASTATGDGDLVGTIKPWAGMTAPNQYAFTYGQEVSRTTYSVLFTAITSTQAAFCNSGSPTLTGLSDTTNFWIGMSVEVSCLGAGFSTVVSKTSSSVTLAANANVTTNTSAVFFPWGRGDGTTTFNLPDFRGFAIAGNNIMGGVASSTLTTTYFGLADPNSSGAPGGSQSISLGTNNLPPYTPSGGIVTTVTLNEQASNAVWDSGAGVLTIGAGAQYSVGGQAATADSTFSGSAQGGTSVAFSRIQPTKTSNYIIKITPDANSATASGVTDISGMTGSIACGTGLICTGNTISSISGSGINILLSTELATAAILPNTPTYSNGALGVGATLTASSNTTLTVDGTSAPLNTTVLVKNQASAFQNGVYSVTAAGSGAAPWVLTRVTYFDQASEMIAGSYTFISSGATNINSSFALQTTVATVGTNAVTWSLFSIYGGNVNGSGSATVGDLPSINNASSTAIVSAGYNAKQIPGLIPTTATVTISNASPGVVTWAGHGLSANDPVFFCTTGALPTGLTACVPATSCSPCSPNTYVSNPTLYYVVGSSIAANNFTVATSIANAKAGTAVNTSSAGSGVHTAFANALACAGCVGELIYNTVEVSGPVAINNGPAPTTWNSLSLTAGIWELGGNIAVIGTSGTPTFTTWHSNLNHGAGNSLSTSPFDSIDAAHISTNNSSAIVLPFTTNEIFLTTTTTINANGQASWTGGGTAGMYGKIYAKRTK